jgi:hypothetical protein
MQAQIWKFATYQLTTEALPAAPNGLNISDRSARYTIKSVDEFFE